LENVSSEGEGERGKLNVGEDDCMLMILVEKANGMI